MLAIPVQYVDLRMLGKAREGATYGATPGDMDYVCHPQAPNCICGLGGNPNLRYSLLIFVSLTSFDAHGVAFLQILDIVRIIHFQDGVARIVDECEPLVECILLT